MTGREQGATTTEVTILVPVVLFWILLTVQVGLWYHATQVATAAADDAVDASQLSAATTSDGEAAASRVLAAAGNVADPRVTVTRDQREVVATVEGMAPQLVPGFAWRVAVRVEAPVERFVPVGER